MLSELETALLDSVKYNPKETKRNVVIRRAAFYYKIQLPRVETKVYYDSPDYVNWRGGFKEYGLKDFRGRTYGIVLKPREFTSSEYAAVLWELRKIYSTYKLQLII